MARRKKVQQDPKLAALEPALIAKYKNLDIIAGTLRVGTGRLQGKRVVSVRCPKCESLIDERAASDLWTLKFCSKCK